ncbi:hypothetical protein AAC387_Pa07g2870 [Persea americana]
MATSYDRGIGGKLRKRPFRRPSTPYDRPPTTLPNPSNSDQRNWVSKLIDPASRIISGSAARLFSSVFRKRLPAPAPLPEANLEPRNELPGEVCTNPSGAKEQGNGEGENQKHSFESSGINEIEQLLKQKTFTRVEFERLIELLRSRTVNLPKDHENKRTEPSISQLVAAQARDEQLIPAQENRGESRISTPTGGFLVPEEEAATLADIAKAYMGSRPSKLSPSSLGFRSQILREDPPLLNIVPSALRSPNMLRAPRSSRHFSGVPQLSESLYMTPRPLRRSAIYSMARSPYTKSHSIAIHKGTEPSDDAYAGSLQSHWTRVDKTLNGGKQVLKRTRSVLDDDSGSVGPMRKIRQKSGLTSPSMYNVPGSPLPSPQTPVGSYSVWGSISKMQKPLSLDGPKLQAAENGAYKLSTTSSAFVPNQSSKVAMKIMQQLDKLVPSPSEKLSESKVAIAPNELNLDMSNGRPFKSTENKHSPRLQNAQHSGTLEGVSGTQLPASGNSLSEKQERIEVNGPVKNIDIGIRSSSVADSVKNTVIGTLSDARPVDSVILGFSSNLPLNERAFQMSASGDVVELEDDNCSSKITSTSHAAEKVEPESYISECKTIVARTVKVEKRVASSERKPAVAENKAADTVSRSADCSIVPSIDAGFASTITSAADSVKPTPPMPPQLSSLFNKSTPKEQPVMTMFGSKSTKKGPAFTFSSTSNNINGASGTKSIDSNCGIKKSTATEDTNPPEATGSGKNEKNLNGQDPKKSSENAITGISTSATPKIFSFGVSTNSNQSNGSLTTAPLFSVSAAPEAPIFGSSASLTFHGSGAATSGCSSSSPMSTAVPVFSASSAFKFGAADSSAATSTTATSSLVSADSELKTKRASLPSSTMGSSVLASTAASTHTTSSVFSFGASVSSSCTTSSFSASNLSQSSTFGATVGSAFGTAIGITPFMQSQFGSSSTPTFGLSGTSSGAAGSPFGPSSSSSKLFSSGSGSGLSSSMSSSASTGSFGSGAGFSFAPASMTASTSSFSFGFRQSTSIFGSGVESTASATGFTFGVSSAASGSTPLTFGSPFGTSSGSLFSFTSAAATTSASTSLSQAQPVFGTKNPAVKFGSASRVNDQIIEDSMAVDRVQASAPVTPPLAGPSSPSSSLNFGFGSAAAPTIGPSAFQFGGHQNTATPQSPSTFPGGGFSVGSGGTDKSNRRIVKIKRDKHRKK